MKSPEQPGSQPETDRSRRPEEADSESPTGAPPQAAGYRTLARGFLADYIGLIVILCGLVLLFGLLSRNFLTFGTFSFLANRIPALTVMAVGMTYVLVVAGIDLSVGSVLALGGSVLGMALANWDWPLWAATSAGLAAGLGCGLINGLVSVGWSIPSFIVTLGMLEMARGGAYLLTDSKTMYLGNIVEPIATPMGRLGISPAFLIAVAIVLIGQVVLTRTVFGRYMIAIGTNEQVVRLSGIDPRPTKIAVFAITGGLTGLASLFYCARLSSADPNAGVGLELSVIAAVVIGGTSLMGGRGSVIASFIGVLIIATLEAGLAQVGASEPTKRVITGAVIIVAVIADAYRHRFSQAKWKRLVQRISGKAE